MPSKRAISARGNPFGQCSSLHRDEGACTALQRRRGCSGSSEEPVEPVVAAAGSGWRKEGPPRREEPMWVSSRAAKVNSRQARFLPPRATSSRATSAWQQPPLTAAAAAAVQGHGRPPLCVPAGSTEDDAHVMSPIWRSLQPEPTSGSLLRTTPH